jgi:hypothetical protein
VRRHFDREHPRVAAGAAVPAAALRAALAEGWTAVLDGCQLSSPAAAAVCLQLGEMFGPGARDRASPNGAGGPVSG